MTFWFSAGRDARLNHRPRSDAKHVHVSARAEWVRGWEWADTRMDWPKGENP